MKIKQNIDKFLCRCKQEKLSVVCTKTESSNLMLEMATKSAAVPFYTVNW